MGIAIDYTGKRILVTGGAQGIGAEIVRQFGNAGAEVVIADINQAAAEAYASELTGDGLAISVYPVDLSDETAVSNMMKSVLPLDILIHNAGYFPLTEFEALSPARIDTTFKINVQSLFWMSQAVLPWFKSQGGGVILCTSSVTGNRVAYPGLSHYASSKAAVNGFIRNAALELGRWNIRVNGVEPGMIRTSAMDNLGDATLNQRIAAGIPLGHLGSPRDIANAMLFLGSELALYITGQTIVVDGGALLPESLSALPAS